MKTFMNKLQQKFNIRLTLIIPYLIFAGIFIIFPMILLFIKAIRPVEGETFLDTAKESSMWNAIGRSIWLGLTASIIALIICFPFTWIVARSKSKTLTLVAIILIISPLLVFTIARVFSLKILLLKIFDNGSRVPVKKWIMILGMVYLYAPFMIIPLYSVLKNMPSSIMEASQDLGFSNFKTIIKVVVPYALKAIFAGLGIVFMLSATSLVISNTLVPASTSGNITNNNNVLIGNVLDVKTQNMSTSSLAAHQGSTIALITIGIMMLVYGGIYTIPILFKKIKGGVNA